jgi:hypothetical protein
VANAKASDGLRPRAGDDDQHLIGLPDRLARPVGQGVVDAVADQLVFLLDGVEPIGYGRIVERCAGETALEVVTGQDAPPAVPFDQAAEAIMENLRDRLRSARHHRDGARGHAALLARDARGAGGQPARERAQQRRINRRHLTHDVVEGAAVELDHDRVAHRDDRCGARNAGKETDLADRLAHADLADRALLPFDPDFEPAGEHDIDRVGRRTLADQHVAAQQIVDFRARPDLRQLIVREIAEDCRRTQQRCTRGARFACHRGPPVSSGPIVTNRRAAGKRASAAGCQVMAPG